MKTIILLKRLNYRTGVSLDANHPYQAVWDTDNSRWVIHLTNINLVALPKYVKEVNQLELVTA
jgi:hypothetical protein